MLQLFGIIFLLPEGQKVQSNLPDSQASPPPRKYFTFIAYNTNGIPAHSLTSIQVTERDCSSGKWSWCKISIPFFNCYASRCSFGAHWKHLPFLKKKSKDLKRATLWSSEYKREYFTYCTSHYKIQPILCFGKLASFSTWIHSESSKISKDEFAPLLF